MDIYQAVVYILMSVGALLWVFSNAFKANSQQNSKLTDANLEQSAILIKALTNTIKDATIANQTANEHDFKVIQSVVATGGVYKGPVS